MRQKQAGARLNQSFSKSRSTENLKLSKLCCASQLWQGSYFNSRAYTVLNKSHKLLKDIFRNLILTSHYVHNQVPISHVAVAPQYNDCLDRLSRSTIWTKAMESQFYWSQSQRLEGAYIQSTKNQNLEWFQFLSTLHMRISIAQDLVNTRRKDKPITMLFHSNGDWFIILPLFATPTVLKRRTKRRSNALQ